MLIFDNFNVLESLFWLVYLTFFFIKKLITILTYIIIIFFLDNLQKAEPLQLIRCKQCCVYVIQKNYNHHLETTAHKISLCYLKNDKIQINGVQCDNRFLSCRILSLEHVSIDDYFQSIESDVLELISKIIRFQNNEAVNVNIKLFGLYNHNRLMSDNDNLGDVKSFMIKNEVIKKKLYIYFSLRKLCLKLNIFIIYFLDSIGSFNFDTLVSTNIKHIQVSSPRIFKIHAPILLFRSCYVFRTIFL